MTISGVMLSCAPQRRISDLQGEPTDNKTISELFCDTSYQYKTLYIRGIESNVLLDEESYNARVSIYYLPDSLIMISAVNAGFEIVRIGITHDSTVYINRLDKIAVVIKEDGLGYAPPVLFPDLEILLNKKLLCNDGDLIKMNDTTALADRSEQDISKKAYYRLPEGSLSKFEFFQKKSGEYVVGEVDEERKIIIYSNYIVKDLTLKAWGGQIELDKELNVNLSVNQNKYDIVYL